MCSSRQSMVKRCLVGCLFASASNAQTLLLNGVQAALFPNATTSCLNAFNTSLNCPQTIQKLAYDFAYINLASADFSALCTTSCASSMQSLAAAVNSGCGNYSFPFNSMTMTTTQVVDLYWWKYNMSCLTSKETGNPCLLQEKTWNITQLQQSGNITWPTYTNKTYPDWSDNPSTGAPMVNVNDTPIANPFDNSYATFNFGSNMSMTAIDYLNANGSSVTYNANAGYGSILESDEYPLQIQCQSCFINEFIMGIQSQWGPTYDNITAQVWANMKQNCNLTQSITPANNFTIPVTNIPAPVYSVCPQSITAPNSTNTTCTSLAQAKNFESWSLSRLNPNISCIGTAPGTYCATQSCQTYSVTSTMNINQMLNISGATNVTLYQFAVWNPFTSTDVLNPGDVVCIGPPGGAYVPTAVVSQAYPTVFTTTASHASPTPSGTVPNCGSYYLVQQGDLCDNVALNKSITFQQLINLNPSINCNCTNMLYSYDYCVAPVHGTNVTAVLCTPAPTPTATSTPSSCSRFVLPPTQTVSGTTSKCCAWYTVKSGDTCSAIDNAYKITFNQFQAWNTYVNSGCTNIWAGYAYCVSSNITVSGSANAKAAAKDALEHSTEHKTKRSTERSTQHSTKTSHSAVHTGT